MAVLRERRAELKQRILQELKRPAPCAQTLRMLKRRKLTLKDELARHEGLLRTLDALSHRDGIRPDGQLGRA
ncbi:YdcH family protein [Ruegeria sp. PrR005]|uniref:YdcH family protein n=2 Tax=Ruegeria sp. PrR005 TaxID=2706882 RepID=A0A6B2NYS8_9RHOB|nr:YdcH family protein [Ruegeria sp. PrR005]